MTLSSSLVLELEDISPRAESCQVPNECQWPNCTCYPQRVAPEPTTAKSPTAPASMACEVPEKCYFPSCGCSRPQACLLK